MRLELLRTLTALGLCLGLGLPATSAPSASPAAAAALDTSPVPARPRSNGLPPHWERGAFIEIFVRAWKDSDGDGVGDLRGLTATLDELQDLGIRGIWLMPVTGNADGDHGYAITDFRAIAPEYGTLADFDELLRQAHARGIGVIMDYVINHASAKHPFFTEALKGPDNPFHRWFIWSDTAPAGGAEGWDIWGAYPWYHAASQPWTWPGTAKTVPRAGADARGFYFGTFGPHMPDFDFRNPAVQAYHLDSLRFWLNRGLDGFRLDATPHLFETSAKDWNDQPESRAFTRQLQDLIKAYPQRYVVCEATAKPDEWGAPAVCGGAFAFGYVHHIVEAARGKAESVQRVATHWLTASATMATFLSNHDSFAGRRLWDQLQGDERRFEFAERRGKPFNPGRLQQRDIVERPAHRGEIGHGKALPRLQEGGNDIGQKLRAHPVFDRAEQSIGEVLAKGVLHGQSGAVPGPCGGGDLLVVGIPRCGLIVDCHARVSGLEVVDDRLHVRRRLVTVRTHEEGDLLGMEGTARQGQGARRQQGHQSRFPDRSTATQAGRQGTCARKAAVLSRLFRFDEHCFPLQRSVARAPQSH